ncbi:NADP-dependent oxidoreductase [Acidipila sp. 4G-K13]|uniref:NADP-dependent oxidoreductase n=2 Tax=Paracidobacterium acidisoli TaxID=2303751 RepID=A0A372INY6_9BACT|nr:NADP-dependent oxidoreductase [Paracidobacterium acidisoli]
MRAALFTGSQQEPLLEETDVPVPTPGNGEILIQVYAAGVTHTELLWYPTTHTREGGSRLHAIPGHEFSGVVTGLGAGITGFSVGDAIFGMNDWFLDGGTAEYCVAAASSIAPKPAHLTHAEAAAVPIDALTAWQGLVDRAKLQTGERVLVHGAAGAVGVFVVQLARLRGAKVIATASGGNMEFVAQLGAQRVIDYRTEAFEDEVQDVDVVFDTIGGETLQRSWKVLKSGGRMVTIVEDTSPSSDDPRAKDAFFIVEPKQEQLIGIGKLLDEGRLLVFVDAEVPFANASAAYARQVKRNLGHGKVVIVMPVNGSGGQG